MDARDIIKEYKDIAGGKQNWLSLWQAIAELFDVNMDSFLNETTRGERKTFRLFNSTGIRASSDFAAIIYAVATNPAERWARLSFRPNNEEFTEEELEWLEDCNDKLFEAINDSNFYREAPLAYRNWGNYGAAILSMAPNKLDAEGRFNGVMFRSEHIRDVEIIIDHVGEMIGYFKEYRGLTFEQAKMMWPEADWPKKFLEDYEKDRLGPKKGKLATGSGLTFIEKVYMVKSENKDSLVTLEDKERPYRMVVCSKDYEAVVLEKGVYHPGSFLFTWARAPGEAWGRGPGSEALADMRTLNEMTRQDLESAAIQLKPPLMTRHNNVIGDMRLIPGGVTVVRDPAGIAPMFNGANVSISERRIDALESKVKSAYMLDRLSLPPRDQVGEMTQFEVQRRVQEMNHALGPVMSRLTEELLRPLIQSLFSMMMRMKAFSPIPESLAEKVERVDVAFENPITRSQKIEEIISTQRWIGELVSLAQAGKPEVMDMIDADAIAIGDARILGVPEKYIADADVVEETRKARAEAQQQQMQADINAKNADAEYKRSRSAEVGGRPVTGG